jgi:hypothetical protein
MRRAAAKKNQKCPQRLLTKLTKPGFSRFRRFCQCPVRPFPEIFMGKWRPTGETARQYPPAIRTDFAAAGQWPRSRFSTRHQVAEIIGGFAPNASSLASRQVRSFGPIG